jgi:hypothetical protein
MAFGRAKDRLVKQLAKQRTVKRKRLARQTFSRVTDLAERGEMF